MKELICSGTIGFFTCFNDLISSDQHIATISKTLSIYMYYSVVTTYRVICFVLGAFWNQSRQEILSASSYNSEHHNSTAAVWSWSLLPYLFTLHHSEVHSESPNCQMDTGEIKIPLCQHKAPLRRNYCPSSVDAFKSLPATISPQMMFLYC